MLFKKKSAQPQPALEQMYPKLASFLSVMHSDWLLDQDVTSEKSILEDATDDEVWRDIVSEGRQVLELRDFPWQKIAELTHAGLRNSREAHQWLAHHINLIEAMIKIERRRRQQDLE